MNVVFSLHKCKEGVTVEIMLYCLLRWLAGGSYIDIRLRHGISPSYFYTSVYKCMDAILGSEELSYKFPSTAKELEEAAQGFEYPGCNKGLCCMSRWVSTSD